MGPQPEGHQPEGNEQEGYELQGNELGGYPISRYAHGMGEEHHARSPGQHARTHPTTHPLGAAREEDCEATSEPDTGLTHEAMKAAAPRLRCWPPQ